jgi:LemA protein
MPTTYIVLIVAALLVLFLITSFNRLVALRNQVQNAWSAIDVQLKRRYDLIPNLVESVKGYMAHERETLDAVTNARTQAMAADSNVAARAVAEKALTGALGNLFAVAERYPALRAVESMAQLQEELSSTENHIAYARQSYNDSVMEYNTAQSTFPRNMVAGIFGFSASTMFATEETARAVPQVKF